MTRQDQESQRDLHIDDKVEKSKEVIKTAIARFGIDKLAIAITGGKDSTTCLWICKQACAEIGSKMPRCMFIDEGDVFDEIREFVAQLKEQWQLEITFLKNEDVTAKVANIGEMVKVASLTERNRAALAEMNYDEEEFTFLPDSTVCNHLLKTVPMQEFIINHKIQALITAIRWDEQTARKEEEYFSPRTNPDHFRVHPILHFRERDIWIAIFKYDIPFNGLYKLGYRSLGAKCATGKGSDIPAWMQDLENTPERVGRGGDKEKIMDQLRALGYM